MSKKKALLMILDGWGIGDKSKSDVISTAGAPNMEQLTANYAHAQLLTSGEDVGLPDGQMGNSEVGHLNIGAGRVVYQDLVRINLAIRDKSIEKNEIIVEAFNYAKNNHKSVHFLGLIGPGGVHAMSHHLLTLCDMTVHYGLKNVFIHALTDGRDTDPRSGLGFMKEVVEHINGSNVKMASLIGRYYTMDRDKRWERVREGYDLMVHGKGTPATDAIKAIENSYAAGVTDEFIKPVVFVDAQNKPVGTIQEGDVVFCFNFRTDRLRQITTALTQKDMPEFGMKTLPLHYVTMCTYDENFKGVHVAFTKDNVENTIGEVVSKNGLKQIRIAETEKYAHVTFFMNGGREEEFTGEKRILINSPKVATYDLQPEMSAFEVKDAIVAELNKREVDFVALNFANGDMVGHTGFYDAISKAVRAVDQCVGEVVAAARNNGYEVVIIADHGNADNALNEDGSPNTAHSLNPVPIVVVSSTVTSVQNGILADVAPTILSMMGLEIPKEMTGKVLVK
ncbi:MAG TPA: 2,3-bisphosphoglycerate-independent phosphoglycerate mutase [Marinilabiliales bacterium]|nr:MAG: phosphoglycerate mutase (2,3-diphosphoglycerate-independent) [Bacteroidetes bacterium GWA2_40_14]OFX59082.1 MAG: phosphoglycerate mutase (2,3-diphosphoglycerate-independent) [Bacteroidetes bacterium GWC2_40_13]OFX72361.1 MAG: phosphoglycerate mutase (2,3-diphosphoglycerate-independent) [Bacteroidetes bacterium GWD2_40_43]OFX90836.1 MAG: phosphoglycerate mutase (2,3-diphosphoglycerate-independent) [Bacteroidetes bacterium GWE2_40_63]OFY17223.1 MAG: phosphoglycerate mutase (2,3-diphosphog